MKTFLVTVGAGLTLAIITGLAWAAATNPGGYLALEENIKGLFYWGLKAVGIVFGIIVLVWVFTMVSEVKAIKPVGDSDKQAHGDDTPPKQEITDELRDAKIEEALGSAKGLTEQFVFFLWCVVATLVFEFFFVALDTVSEAMNPAYYEELRKKE